MTAFPSTKARKVVPIGLSAQQREIVDLAFLYWRDRLGFRDGTPEQDFLQAHRDITRRVACLGEENVEFFPAATEPW
jgi:hypothetical protein